MDKLIRWVPHPEAQYNETLAGWLVGTTTAGLRVVVDPQGGWMWFVDNEKFLANGKEDSLKKAMDVAEAWAAKVHRGLS